MARHSSKFGNWLKTASSPMSGKRRSNQVIMLSSASGAPKEGKNSATAHSRKQILTSQNIIMATATIVIMSGLGLALFGQYATIDFIVLVSSLLVLSGLVASELVARWKWEQDLAQTLNKMIKNQDRLVREVARNRNDLAVLKEGLSETAMMLKTQGRKLTPSPSPEARMIETIVERLNELGEKPRAEIRTEHDREILELQMAPPPLKEPPETPLDSELNADLSQLDSKVIADLIEYAVSEDRINVFMQGIVSLPQRKTRFYEIFGRLEAAGGGRIPAERYRDLSDRLDMTTAIDTMVMLKTFDLIRTNFKCNVTPNYKFFVNIRAVTLQDRRCMGDLISFLSEHKDMASHIIFEMAQSEYENLTAELLPVLEGLSRLGCRFSMDRVRNRKFDIQKLKAMRLRYIKFDVNWLINESNTQNGFSRIHKLKGELDKAGIDLIVERIENEEQLRELLDFNIDYGQGYLFGKPDTHIAYRDSLKAA